MIWFLYIFIYWFVGFLTIFVISTNDKSSESPGWIIGYGFGSFLWPIILFVKFYKWINKFFK